MDHDNFSVDDVKGAAENFRAVQKEFGGAPPGSPIYEFTYRASRDPNLDELSIESQERTAENIRILQDFYVNPYNDKTECWRNAWIATHYLTKHKPKGTKRKNGHEEDIEHEIALLLRLKKLVDIGLVPRRITYKMEMQEDGTRKRVEIPEEEQSIENLFIAITIHDLPEDRVNSTFDEFKDFMQNFIRSSLFDFHEKRLEKYDKQIEANRNTLISVTHHKRKINPKTGEEYNHKLFKDRLAYTIGYMKSIWGAACKGVDRKHSLDTRYGPVADYMKIESDIKHLAETTELFFDLNFFKEMKETYPELEDFYDDLENNFKASYECVLYMTLLHPSTQNIIHDKHYKDRDFLMERLKHAASFNNATQELYEQIQDPAYDARNVKIDLRETLYKAGKYAAHFEGQERMLEKTIDAFLLEAGREGKESLKPFARQLYTQYHEVTPKYENQPGRNLNFLSDSGVKAD